MKLGIVMDPIERINIKKDSSFAMLLATQQRDCEIWYMEQNDLLLRGDEALASMKPLKVQDDPQHWFDLGDAVTQPLHALDVILMRKDPPINLDYYVTTYILEHAQRRGTLVLNNPGSLRDINEKMYCTWFADLMTPTLVAKDPEQIKAFIRERQDVVLKPLHSMGGESVFHIRPAETNLNVIIETLTQRGQHFIMAQHFIPEITQGDKRILLVNGEPVPYALARIPKAGEIRGNLAAGGSAKGVELSDRDREICARVGPVMKDKGMLFVGLDVIGDYLTEINVTSPTCIRELDREFGLDIAGDFMDVVLRAASQ